MAENYVRRTAITRVSVTDAQRPLLEATITEWKRGCQLATDLAWEKCNAKREVQALAYDAVREQTDIGSQHAVLATHQAAQAITGCIERRLNGKPASKPTFTSPTLKYDDRTMTVFDDGSVSLATVDNRVRGQLVLPDADDGYQWVYLDDDAWRITESTLTSHDGDFLMHIGFRRPESSVERTIVEEGTVLGVDLGIDNLVVTSTARFLSGREFTHRLDRFDTVRAGLQRTGTRSAHRTLAQSRGRRHRYTRDVLHRASKAVIEEAVTYECDVIAFEDLTDIRDRTGASWGDTWPFRQLYEQVEYKGRAVGIAVRQVQPERTSTQCSECGYTDPENRPTRLKFRCQDCGSEANADYNAAKTIGMRYVRRSLQSPRRTGNSQLALKSGTVTPDGEFTPYPDGFQVEFTDKPHLTACDCRTR